MVTWLTISGTVLEILAPVVLYFMKSWGSNEKRRQEFQDWVSSIQARRAEAKKVKSAAYEQAEDIEKRIKEKQNKQ